MQLSVKTKIRILTGIISFYWIFPIIDEYLLKSEVLSLLHKIPSVFLLPYVIYEGLQMYIGGDVWPYFIPFFLFLLNWLILNKLVMLFVKIKG